MEAPSHHLQPQGKGEREGGDDKSWLAGEGELWDGLEEMDLRGQQNGYPTIIRGAKYLSLMFQPLFCQVIGRA